MKDGWWWTVNPGVDGFLSFHVNITLFSNLFCCHGRNVVACPPQPLLSTCKHVVPALYGSVNQEVEVRKLEHTSEQTPLRHQCNNNSAVFAFNPAVDVLPIGNKHSFLFHVTQHWNSLLDLTVELNVCKTTEGDWRVFTNCCCSCQIHPEKCESLQNLSVSSNVFGLLKKSLPVSE